MIQKQNNNNLINNAIVNEIAESVESLKYGQIVITVHNSKII